MTDHPATALADRLGLGDDPAAARRQFTAYAAVVARDPRRRRLLVSRCLGRLAEDVEFARINYTSLRADRPGPHADAAEAHYRELVEDFSYLWAVLVDAVAADRLPDLPGLPPPDSPSRVRPAGPTATVVDGRPAAPRPPKKPRYSA